MLRASSGGNWHTVYTAEAGHPIWSVAIDSGDSRTAYAVVGPYPGNELVATRDGGETWPVVPFPDSSGPHTVSSSNGVLYATTYGLLTSRDQGRSWTKIPSPGWDNKMVYIVPPSTVIVGSDQGLHRTSDGGNTWDTLTGTISSSLLTGVAVHASTIVTAVQDFSPILSFDAGANWQQPVWISGLPVGEDGVALINPSNPRYCYLHTTSGFQYSNDGCHSFHFSVPPLTYPFHFAGANIVAVDSANPSTIYAVSDSGIFRSADWGATMTSMNWGLSQVTAIAVHPANSNVIYVGTEGGLYGTQDGGKTWNQLSLAGSAGFPSTIAISPQNPNVVLVGMTLGVGRGGGIVKSTDGGSTFHVSNSGLSTAVKDLICCGREMQSLRFNADPNLSLTALATETGIYVSTDSGDHWLNVTGNSVPTYFADVALDAGYIYAATFGRGVLKAPIASLLVTSVPTIISVNTAGGGSDIAQNTWIEIKGKNLVPANTPATDVTWSSAPDFALGRMPTQINGVSVTVNGKQAYVYFFCSGVTSRTCDTDQVNVLTPLDDTVGPGRIVVTNGTTTSAPYTVNIRAIAPSFLLFNAQRYVVATHSDFTLLGPVNLYPGFSTPARPNESVMLYGVGFGLPSTPLVNGSSTQSGSLPFPVTCYVEGAKATVAFAGLISPGLYQLNLILPSTAANGDSAVVCTYDSSGTPDGDLISVQF